MSKNYVVIMAGGIGSRFWPASRKARPKQFLDILGIGKSLIRLTFERFLEIIPASNILVVTHEDYNEAVQKELPELGKDQILSEPSRKNTAPCIAYAAYKIAAKDPNANFVVAPADHLILKEAAFLRKIEEGLQFVEEHEVLLTLGIQPSHPNTGYGYIHFDQNQQNGDFFKVHQFTEKPDLATAEEFLKGGEHLWNAGIFLWNVQTLLNSFSQHATELYQAFESQKEALKEKERATICEIYDEIESISIDYALMEKSNQIYTLPADIGWSDIGTWGALHKVLEKDEKDNAILTEQKEQVILQNVKDCLLRSTQKNKLLILAELEDYIVVDEEDVLLIYPKSKEQEIKSLRAKVEEDFEKKYS